MALALVVNGMTRTFRRSHVLDGLKGSIEARCHEWPQEVWAGKCLGKLQQDHSPSPKKKIALDAPYAANSRYADRNLEFVIVTESSRNLVLGP